VYIYIYILNVDTYHNMVCVDTPCMMATNNQITEYDESANGAKKRSVRKLARPPDSDTRYWVKNIPDAESALPELTRVLSRGGYGGAALDVLCSAAADLYSETYGETSFIYSNAVVAALKGKHMKLAAHLLAEVAPGSRFECAMIDRAKAGDVAGVRMIYERLPPGTGRRAARKAMYRAIEHRQLAVVTYLLDVGASSADHVLVSAAHRGDEELMRLALDRGATRLRSALSTAICKQNTKAMRFLRAAGAVPTMRDVDLCEHNSDGDYDKYDLVWLVRAWVAESADRPDDAAAAYARAASAEPIDVYSGTDTQSDVSTDHPSRDDMSADSEEESEATPKDGVRVEVVSLNGSVYQSLRGAVLTGGQVGNFFG